MFKPLSVTLMIVILGCAQGNGPEQIPEDFFVPVGDVLVECESTMADPARIAYLLSSSYACEAELYNIPINAICIVDVKGNYLRVNEYEMEQYRCTYNNSENHEEDK